MKLRRARKKKLRKKKLSKLKELKSNLRIEKIKKSSNRMCM